MHNFKNNMPLIVVCALLLITQNLWASHGEEDQFDKHKVDIAFQGWLAAFKKEAKVKGISDRTLESALAPVQPIPRVIELDRNQPESKLLFSVYSGQIVTRSRIERARQAYQDNKEIIDSISRTYDVPARYIVALWGIESDFGRLKGKFPVIDVLATLAYDGRRPDYFRDELLNAFVMVDKGMVQLPDFIGSWAGAMGQTQFMPSTFLKYAVDQSEDGKIDLWNSVADALGSGANYLSKAGWRPGETWGREVSVPNTVDASLLSLDMRKSIKEWHDLGVRRRDGRELPGQTKLASIVRLEDASPRYFLVYDNFRVIRDWNRSNHFAATVGLFANSLGF